MTRDEHLPLCLSEECDEVGQRVSKALRFGLAEVQAGQSLTNNERICDELCDLISVAQLLMEQGLLSSFMPTEVEISAKAAKISKYMEISREQGALQS